MAKKRLTRRQQEWKIEYALLKRRAQRWVEEFHAVADLPERPKRITKEAIEKLRNMRWPKIPESLKKQWREEYEKRYEEGQEGIYFPKPPYKPPTEGEWLKIPYEDILPRTVPQQDTTPDEDGYNPNVDSEAELYDWIERVIQSVTVPTTSPWGTPNEIHGERAKIIQLIESAFNNAKNKFGEDLKFLEYLEENADEFNELTLKAIHGYESGGENHYIEQGGEQAMGQILTLLNFGAPVSQWAEEEDMRNGDFSNVFWGNGEDFYQ